MSPPSLLATSKGWRCRNFAATGARGRPKQRLAATKCLHTCHPLERKGESEPEDDDDMTVVDYNEDDDDDESLSVRTVKSNSSSNTSMSSRGSASSKVSAGDRAVHRLSAVMRSAWGRVGPVLSSNHLFPKLQCVQIRLGSDDPFNDQQQSMPPLMILLSAMDYLRPDLEKLRAERAELDVRLKLHMPNSSFDNVHREIEAWWCQFWNEAEVRVDVTPTD